MICSTEIISDFILIKSGSRFRESRHKSIQILLLGSTVLNSVGSKLGGSGRNSIGYGVNDIVVEECTAEVVAVELEAELLNGS